MQKIICLDNGEVFPSYQAVADFEGVHISSVYRVINGSCDTLNNHHYEKFKDTINIRTDCKYYDENKKICVALKRLYCCKEGTDCWRYKERENEVQ